ncbi:hypothetical protein D3C76_1799530 [compost metagenome]
MHSQNCDSVARWYRGARLWAGANKGFPQLNDAGVSRKEEDVSFGMLAYGLFDFVESDVINV